MTCRRCNKDLPPLQREREYVTRQRERDRGGSPPDVSMILREWMASISQLHPSCLWDQEQEEQAS